MAGVAQARTLKLISGEKVTESEKKKLFGNNVYALQKYQNRKSPVDDIHVDTVEKYQLEKNYVRGHLTINILSKLYESVSTCRCIHVHM